MNTAIAIICIANSFFVLAVLYILIQTRKEIKEHVKQARDSTIASGMALKKIDELLQENKAKEALRDEAKEFKFTKGQPLPEPEEIEENGEIEEKKEPEQVFIQEPSPKRPRLIIFENDFGKEAPTTQTPEINYSDSVKCSVFAPPAASTGSNIMVQVFAHLYDQDDLVRKFATEFDEKAKLRATKPLMEQVQRGSDITFHLSLPGVEVDEPIQKITWRGIPDSVQYAVQIPRDCQIFNIIGTVCVSQGSIPFGHVKFQLTIINKSHHSGKLDDRHQLEDTWKRYKKAFISYASSDRSEVLKRVQMLAAFGIEYFHDLLSLEPGQRWEKELYKHIDNSDVFFLFWSNAAKNSTWVMQEVKYALERKKLAVIGNPEIVPVIIEGPPPVTPPDELTDIHFNDKLIYFINSTPRPTERRRFFD